MQSEIAQTQAPKTTVLVTDAISCPDCGASIPLTETISHQIEERLRQEYETGSRQTEAAFTAALAAKDAEIAGKDAEIEAKVQSARAELEAAAQLRADEVVATNVRELSERVESQGVRIAEAQERELALLASKRELEERQASFDLEIARKLDDERATLISGTTERLEEEFKLKLRERDLKLEQMNKHIEELRASADQKRSGLQGEVLERELENILRETFPSDLITPVKAGARGADVLQRVRSSRGLDCGAILWESKNTKHWNNGWVEKLKDDQRAEKADMAIIVSSVLPDAVHGAAVHDGVWICDFIAATTFATALRLALIEVAQSRVVDANKSLTAEALYEYLCGKDFQHRFTTGVQAVVVMKQELDTEKRATQRTWAKREKQIERLLNNSAGIFGELQAIVGDALSPVPVLELPVTTEDESGPLARAS
jgi:hypothetical protein